MHLIQALPLEILFLIVKLISPIEFFASVRFSSSAFWGLWNSPQLVTRYMDILDCDSANHVNKKLKCLVVFRQIIEGEGAIGSIYSKIYLARAPGTNYLSLLNNLPSDHMHPSITSNLP